MSNRRAAVIGSGFGGLALAVRLQAAGVPTTLLEKRDRPGGRAYVYEDGRFTFDGGPTVITAPECLEAVFAAAGRSMSDYVDLLPVHPFYRLYWEDGYTFDYSNDVEALNEQIAKKNPRDVDGYSRFVRYAEDVFEEGYVKLANVPFLDFWSMIRVAPQLIRLQAFRSVYSMVAHYIKDPHLRQVFSFHSLLVGGNPFASSSIYTLIHSLERKWGVFFVRGGTGKLVDAYVRLFEELGGEVRTNCPVEKIRTSGGRVTGVECADGFSGDFDAVASNADVVHTYDRLLSDESLARPVASSLTRRRFSMSLCVIYFGTRRRHPDLAHHCVLLGPRYKGLLDDIFNRGRLSEDFSLYLHAPTITDPQVAPEGCEAFYVLSPVPHLGKASIDWKQEGPRYRDRILGHLEQRYIPGLSDDLETVRIITPEDFRDSLNSHLGSAFSLEPILRQSAWFRVHNRDDRIGGLYFVGAGTHPGAGVPGVVNSAEATAGLMLKDLGVAGPRSLRDVLDPVVEHSRTMIREGSKSFAGAAKVLSPSIRDSVYMLYAWCRYCDDRIDLQDLGRGAPADASSDGLARLKRLEAQTARALAGESVDHPVFVALQRVVERHEIPHAHPMELLHGFEMDVEGRRYSSLDDVLDYCYHVAGVVGVMMAHVMGARQEQALDRASDLGIALQMTNISRDVMDDASSGRVYLPENWLTETGVPPAEIAEVRHRPAVVEVVRRFLAEADRYYDSGALGIPSLGFRSAWAVTTARGVYRDIGGVVSSRGEAAWDVRAFVGTPRKLYRVARGAFEALSAVGPGRRAEPPPRRGLWNRPRSTRNPALP